VLANAQGDLDEAVIMLEKSLETNNENVYSYLALGDVYEKQKNYEKSLSVYKQLASMKINVGGLNEKIK